jgi:phage-related protein
MGGEMLRVDTPVLDTVGSSFGQAATGLAALGADAPLGDAAGAVSQLRTAAACRQAQTAVAELTTAVAKAAQTYGESLQAAVSRYESRDASSAEAVDSAL